MVRPTFLGFETARRGLSASQKGLDITGQNMSNVSTPGYTRQRLDLVSLSTAPQDRFRSVSATNAGEGVQVAGVNQIRDRFLDTRLRNETANEAYFEASIDILHSLEGVLNEIDQGFKPLLSDVITSLHGFALSPDQTTQANMVRTALHSLAGVMNHTSTQLDQLSQQFSNRLEVDVNEFNLQLKSIANFNQAIVSQGLQSSEGMSTSSMNELLDQRNLALDKISRFLNVQARFEDNGTVSLSVNDHTILSDEFVDSINLVTSPHQGLSLTWQSSGQAVQAQAGTLIGTLEYINGDMPQSAGIAYYQRQLDTLSRSLAAVFNQAFTNTDGSYKTLLSFENDNAARSLSVSEAFSANPRYLVQSGGALANQHIQQLISRLEGTGDVEGFDGSFYDFIQQYSVNLAQDITFTQTRHSVSSSIVFDLEQRRDSISGVSLDEEGAEMMKHIKSFNAIARLMTTMDEALDIIINRLGTVGR